MNANYFFIDGSALAAQIRQLQRAEPSFQKKRLCPRKFLDFFMRSLQDLHGNSYKRAIFYFPKGDEAAIQNYFQRPDHKQPGEIRDLHFKFCGHKMKKSAEFDKFVEEEVPSKFKTRFSKSEKGIDIEMCCDALRLASTSRIERIFLLTNDGDFVPFCRTIKEFGANVSIIHLSKSTPPNSDLLEEADSYDIVSDANLPQMFFPFESQDESAEIEIITEINTDKETPQNKEKPEAEPSDLKLVSSGDSHQD